MKLFRLKKRFEDDKQLFHLVEKVGWKSQEKWHDKMLNFHVKIYCSPDRIMVKGDSYVNFDKVLHRKKICSDCFSVFKLSRKK